LARLQLRQDCVRSAAERFTERIANVHDRRPATTSLTRRCAPVLTSFMASGHHSHGLYSRATRRGYAPFAGRSRPHDVHYSFGVSAVIAVPVLLDVSYVGRRSRATLRLQEPFHYVPSQRLGFRRISTDPGPAEVDGTTTLPRQPLSSICRLPVLSQYTFPALFQLQPLHDRRPSAAGRVELSPGYTLSTGARHRRRAFATPGPAIRLTLSTSGYGPSDD